MLLAEEVPRSGSAPQMNRSAVVDRFLGRVRWNEVHQRMATLPVFADCSRAEIRRLAREGDECLVPAGVVLCREDQIGYWMFVVMAGEVLLSRQGRAELGATLGPGDHVGEIAILGFGPQPETATALVDTWVFALGRRPLLGFQSIPGLQRGLFPGIDSSEVPEKVRELRRIGTAQWKYQRRRVEASPPRAEALPVGLRTFAARDRNQAHPFVGVFAQTVPPVMPASDARPMSRLALAVVTMVISAAALVGSLAYHPGVLVVRPSDPVEVTHDLQVEVEGISVRPPTGRYILTAVDISEPNLLGLLNAIVRDELRLPSTDGADDPDAQLERRQQFVDSQQQAIRLVAARVGTDPEAFHVRFKARPISGPSAGLVYALVLADMVGQVEPRSGQVLAATGTIDDLGRVLPVGYLEVKRRVARRVHADVFLVPGHVAPAAAGIVGVDTFEQALEASGAGR